MDFVSRRSVFTCGFPEERCWLVVWIPFSTMRSIKHLLKTLKGKTPKNLTTLISPDRGCRTSVSLIQNPTDDQRPVEQITAVFRVVICGNT